MKNEEKWDWDVLKKEIPIKEWQENYNWVEEFYVSPDGERIASIVNTDEAEFSVCVNGEVWEETFEKAWSLRFAPNGKLVALVSNDEEWTICTDGSNWETWFDYIWDLKITSDGSFIGAAVQKDGEYGMAVNDTIWENLYGNISGAVLSDQGTSAAIVQVTPMGQGDIEGFSAGIFSAAVNGVNQPEKFMNIWDISFDNQGEQIAYSVRKNRTDYSLVKNNELWDKDFQFVWQPQFIGNDMSLVAPVRQSGKWTLFKDGNPFWKKSYGQLWKLVVHQESGKLAGVISDAFGRWDVTEDEKPWSINCDTMVSDLYYSVNGDSLVAVFKNKGFWDVAVNGKPWNIRADKLWNPVVSSNDQIYATRMEKDGKFFLVVNGKIYKEEFDMVFEPAISSENDKILLKSINNGIYTRQILTLDNIL